MAAASKAIQSLPGTTMSIKRLNLNTSYHTVHRSGIILRNTFRNSAEQIDVGLENTEHSKMFVHNQHKLW